MSTQLIVRDSCQTVAGNAPMDHKADRLRVSGE
jgi:hypothetical protein